MTRPAPVTLDDIKTWPAVVDMKQAAQALGISPSHAYECHARSQFPVRTIKVGNRIKVLTADLVRVLGGA